MVETWRWPKASYSVLSIWAVFSPSRAAGETTDGRHRRIGFDDVHELLELLLQGLEGDALGAADAALQGAVVLIREEALGHNAHQIEIEGHGDEQDRHDGLGIVQRPVQRPAIEILHGLEGAP